MSLPPEMWPGDGPPDPDRGGRGGLNPAAVPVERLCRLLALVPDTVRRHIAEGCPTNPDGTINLVHYAAWLNTAGR